MVCPRCRFEHTVSLHPVFAFSVSWFGRVRRVKSGTASVCWRCQCEFIVLRDGKTILREDEPARATPRLVPREKPQEPPVERLIEEDMIPEPRF